MVSKYAILFKVLVQVLVKIISTLTVSQDLRLDQEVCKKFFSTDNQYKLEYSLLTKVV